MPAIVTIKIRRGTAAAWTTADSILAAGEMGLETDTLKFKFGDGSTAWTSLGYAVASSKYLGLYTTLGALETAYPTATPGNYADVDPGSGTDIVRYIWDEDEGWVAGGSGSGDVVGPASAVDERIAVFDSTSGKLLKDGGKLIADIDAVGVHDLFIPASAMWPRITGGCAPIQRIEMAASLANIQVLAFDQTTQEFAQFQIVLPRKWNGGTITVVPYWTAEGGAGTVQWGISGGAYSNDDPLTVALGSAQTSDDTLLSANDLHIGPATSAITLAGSPADADFLMIQVSRNTGSDTLTSDALLLGISIRLTTDAVKDV